MDCKLPEPGDPKASSGWQHKNGQQAYVKAHLDDIVVLWRWHRESVKPAPAGYSDAKEELKTEPLKRKKKNLRMKK